LAEEHLPREYKQFEAVDALALEQHDFINAIRMPRQPLDSGAAGRDAVAVAERILACVHGAKEPLAPAASQPTIPLAPQSPVPYFDLAPVAARVAG
jgi:hypothetical protein